MPMHKMADMFAFKYAKSGFAILMALMIIVSYSPLAVYSSQSPNATYYVSPTGDDSNPGTLEAPWRTIQKAANTMVGGNTAIVRGGIYEEFVTIKSSGSELHGYITFQAYPGEKPVIDGANLSIGSGRSSLIHLRNANYVIVDGFEVRNLTSSSSSEYPAGIRVQSGGSNIHLLNNNVHHIANMSSAGNAHGIHVYGDELLPITDVRVSSNQVHSLTLGSSEALTISGNVDGFIVDRNTVFNNNNIGIDIAGYYGACSVPCQDQARNGTVSDNTVYGIDSSGNPAYGTGTNSAGGIYADGATNIVIERNHVYGSDFGIEVASENTGKTTSKITVRNNYIHHNDGAGIIMGGSERDNGGASDNLLYNNTLLFNDQLRQGYGEITLQENNFNNRIVNNLVYALPRKSFVYKSNTTGSGNIVDYNLYYRADGTEGVPWKWQGQTFSTWEEYKESTGHDTHSLFADPMLADVSGGPISLLAGSPAIDRGTDILSSEMDLYGLPRKQGASIDIGASEYNSLPATTPSPIVIPEATPAPTADSGGTPTSSPPQPSEPAVTTPGQPQDGIVIDGSLEDWTRVSNLAAGSSNVTALKTEWSSNRLNVLATGHLLSEKGQFYLNADGDEATGFQAPYWDKAGADYLIENGILYSYSGSGGSNWGWTEINNYKKLGLFKATSSVIEVSIPLSDIASTNEIRIGFVWKDSHDNKLPMSNSLAAASSHVVNEPEMTSTPSATIKPGATPVPTSPKIVVDGKVSDWSGVAYVGQGSSNPSGLKLFHDHQYLYILLEGKKLSSKIQFYVNTDMNANTGYKVSNWETSGAEYLVENGRVYKYSGKGSNWSWQSIISLKSDDLYKTGDTFVEASIPLTHLTLKSGNQMTIGAVLGDSKTLQLPAKGEIISYSLK